MFQPRNSGPPRRSRSCTFDKCGASPAKDSSVELHIDHIKPWSKGGETVMENLETLCSIWNLGKSDLE
ncbi:MAG: HNH endonuclease [Oscillospiraceae bacterium]|nr:HNH endonuclease [Oscillospiraceae bacterium]MBR0354343.1 HNH endonuclease [Oscillospiraceae bacterium]